MKTDGNEKTSLQNFYEMEGINLDESKMVKNPGMRGLSKLSMNNFWGKLGQRDNKLVTSFLTDPSKFFDLINDSTVHIKSFDLFNDDVASVTYSLHNECVVTSDRTNVVLAS